VFLAACGFEYNGPQGHIGFAPRLTPESFKAPFTAAEGWGTYRQRTEGGGLRAEIAVKWGQLRIRTLAFAVTIAPVSVTVKAGDTLIGASVAYQAGRATVTLNSDITLAAGQAIEVFL